MICPHCGREIEPRSKTETSPENAVGWQKPHHRKVDHFLGLGLFDVLECSEYKVRIPLRKGTYNPDYYHRGTDTYIEITTSMPNISEQRWKWQEAMEHAKLRVFWWQGQEITDEIRKGSRIGRLQRMRLVAD